jgi:hypothetical protein
MKLKIIAWGLAILSLIAVGCWLTMFAFFYAESRLGLTGLPRVAAVAASFIVLVPTWFQVAIGWKNRKVKATEFKHTWQRDLLVAFITGILVGTAVSIQSREAYNRKANKASQVTSQ